MNRRPRGVKAAAIGRFGVLMAAIQRTDTHGKSDIVAVRPAPTQSPRPPTGDN